MDAVTRWALLSLALALFGCGEAATSVDAAQPATDSGPQDAGPSDDAGADAGLIEDAGTDSGPIADAGRDAGPSCVADIDDYPTPQTGRCRAVIRTTDDPTLTAGDDTTVEPGTFIVPGGERLIPVGRNVRVGGFPMRMIEIPGTDLVIVTDGGLTDEVLAVVDLSEVAMGGTNGIVSTDVFEERTGEALFLGLAYSTSLNRIYASGGGQNVIHVFDVNTTTGALTAVEEISVRMGGYAAGLALLPDGTLLVTLLEAHAMIHVDPATGAELGMVAFENQTFPYDVILSPDGATAFVSLWGMRQVAVIDVATLTIRTRIDTGKNPQGMALSPDGATLAVACSDSDVVELVSVATNTVSDRFFIVGETAPRGAAPAAVRFGADGRLYVVDALENAIDVLERGMSGWTRVGRVPTMWHPTDVLPRADGSLVFLNGRHRGTGPNPGNVNITNLMGGSLTVLDPGDWDDTQLAMWATEIAVNNTRMSDAASVECDPGAAYDFPIPPIGSGTPSSQITHVFLVVRENKTHDAYLGDLGGRGDPDLLLIPPAQIEMILPNTRAIAREFAFADNYYSHAEQSLQGHVWTSLGRTTDFVERTWLSTWGRGYFFPPPQALMPIGYPEEGGAMRYFIENGVTVQNYGELPGADGAPGDPSYPGLFYTMAVRDSLRGEYLAGRIASCRIRQLSYLIMPNDHTDGLTPGRPTPESHIADNDEGVGRLIEAISHSTYWPNTVVFVIEDDPQNGGDHIDNHRSPLLVASPWARRGHISPVHVSEASIWRTIRLIFGLEDVPHSAEWDEAAPLYDFFTSTPDYTPYDLRPRVWPVETNPRARTANALLSASYDFSEPDEQPELNRILWEHFHRDSEAPAP